MKLASFSHCGQRRIGIVDVAASRVHPLDASFGDMAAFIARSPDLASLKPAGEPLALDGLTLLAPLLSQRNIFCVGKNYRAHAKEFSGSGFEAGAVKGAEIDEYPAVFSKPPSTVVAHGDTVSLHPGATSAVDYEAELAVIIGKPGRDIAREQALSHAWGYTVVNDVTARDRQRNHKQWFLGKALDTFCPMGPVIVTSDEIDPENLQLKTWINGELRQNANTGDLIFDIPTIIEVLSAGMTLEVGDVIATGTAAGVGIGFTPPKFLKPGDEMRLEIEGIGTLVNRME